MIRFHYAFLSGLPDEHIAHLVPCAEAAWSRSQSIRCVISAPFPQTKRSVNLQFTLICLNLLIKGRNYLLLSNISPG